MTDISVGEIGEEFDALWLDKVNEKTHCLQTEVWRHSDGITRSPGIAATRARCVAREMGDYSDTQWSETKQPDENGLRKSIVADLLAKKDEPAVVEALLAAAYNQAIRAGSHILEVVGFPESIRRVFAQSRPYQRQYPACPYYYKAADPIFHKTLSDIAAWYACPYDGDATLIRPSYSRSLQLWHCWRTGGRQSTCHSGSVVEGERTEVF